MRPDCRLTITHRSAREKGSRYGQLELLGGFEVRLHFRFITLCFRDTSLIKEVGRDMIVEAAPIVGLAFELLLLGTIPQT